MVDGVKQTGIARINLDARYLRGIKDGDIIQSGRLVEMNNYLILVDGENSGEVLRAPIDGYQGSTFKQLEISSSLHNDYVLCVINSNRKTLRESKTGSAIPHLNKKLFKDIKINLPPYNEQIRIVERINDFYMIFDEIMTEL